MVKTFQDTIKSNLKKIKDSLDTNSPQEAFPNGNAIDSTTERQILRPNNFRRQIAIKRHFSMTLTTIKTTIDSTTKLQNKGILQVEQSEHTKQITIKNFEKVIIQISKNNLTAIRPQNKYEGKKEEFIIEGNLIQRRNRIKDITNKWQYDLDNAINKFLDIFPECRITEKIYWANRGSEIELKGDKGIDSIPKNISFYCDSGKKVYKEGFEFQNDINQNPTEKIINYINNRALEDNLPILNSNMEQIKLEIQTLKHAFNTLNAYDQQIALHLEVEQKQLLNQIKISEALDRLNTLLSEPKKSWISKLFNKK